MDGSASMHALDAERYEAFWRHTPESLFTVRVLPDGGFEFDGLNPAHEKRTGLSNSDLAGKTPHEVLDFETAEAITERYRMCVEGGEPVTYLETLDLPAGQRHWETSLAPVRDREGRIHLLLGSARDVTDRLVVQRALAESEARFRTVTEMAPNILFSARADEGPDYVSPRLFEYADVSPDGTPRDWLSVMHPGDLKIAAAQARSKDLPFLEQEVRLRGKDGEYRWFQLRANKLEQADGRRWFGVATDIHDVKLAADRINSLNERLRLVVSSVSDGYYTIDRSWRMTSVNDAALQWMRRTEADVVGIDVRTWLTAHGPLWKAIEEGLATGRPAELEGPSVFQPGRWVEYHAYPSEDGLSVFFRDITDRRAAQEEVEAARALFQGSLDAMSAEVAVLDRDGIIVAANAAWRNIVRDRGAEIPNSGVGSLYIDVCRRVMSTFDEAAVTRALHDLAAGRIRQFTQAVVKSAAGSAHWRQLRINRFEHRDALYFVAVREDVTEALKAREALRDATQRLLSAQEDERHRIAVELHDSTSQHLVALSLGVARLRNSMDPRDGAEPVLEDMAVSVDEALREVRVLSYLLNPPDLDRHGLERAIRNFVDGFGRRTGLHTMIRIEGRLARLAADVQHTIYRVVQEALSNVHRHAAAEGVEIELSLRGGTLALNVVDDGRGLGPSNPLTSGDARLGVGIPGMAARVEQLGGSFAISSDGAGTRLSAAIPLNLASARQSVKPTRRIGYGAADVLGRVAFRPSPHT